MNRLTSAIVIGCGLMVGSLSVDAQTRYRDPYPQSGGGYDYGRGQQDPVGRVMSDLNRAADRARLDGHEWRHFNDVAKNLREFEERLSRGKFDTGKLDHAIRSLEHLASADRVRGRDREMLDRDADELRRFRASRGGFDRNRYEGWR